MRESGRGSGERVIRQKLVTSEVMCRATPVRELSDDELNAVSGGTFGEPMGKTDVIKVMGTNPRLNTTAMNVWYDLLRQYRF